MFGRPPKFGIFVEQPDFLSQLDNSNGVLSKPFSSGWVFIGLWLLVAALYSPATKAGFVADFTGWLDQTQRYGFWENINRTHYHGRSLYQFTQLNTWLLYQVLGTSALAWHFLFVTLQATNATLLYRLCNHLLYDTEVTKRGFISLAGVLLFCVSPALSEVVIWEPSFHFLQGLFLIVLILNLAHEYLVTGKEKYEWQIGVLFLLSSFSLEIFYITPFLLLTMALFYRHSHPYRRLYVKRTMSFVFLPQLAVLAFHFILFRLVYKGWVAHIGTDAVTTAMSDGWGKPMKHLFNTLLLGRFWPDGWRGTVYSFCDSGAGIAAFYGVVALLSIIILIYFRTLGNRGKAMSLLFGWVLLSLSILVPLWFEPNMLVVFDRYTYFVNAFLFLLVALLVSKIRVTNVRVAIIVIYALVSIRFTIQVSRYWMKSARVINSLMATFPHAEHKKIVLLNLTQNMHGVPMIGAEKESEFRLMYNGLHPGKKVDATVYDAMAYNMVTPDDGANVTVVNDSIVKVTLNQWGTWWWYGMKGGSSYENEDYKLDLKDPGHWYELKLKHPAAQYLLLFQVGDQWRTVDMTKVGQEQR